MLGGKVPHDPAAHGIANEVCAGDPELVHEIGQDLHLARVGIVARGIWTGQAKARKIETDDPITRGQDPGPRFPRVEAGAESVQHDHGRRVTRPGVTQPQPQPVDRPVFAGIGRLQLGARLVWRVKEYGWSEGRQCGQCG